LPEIQSHKVRHTAGTTYRSLVPNSASDAPCKQIKPLTAEESPTQGWRRSAETGDTKRCPCIDEK